MRRLLVLALPVLLFPIFVHAADAPSVHILDTQGETISSFSPWENSGATIGGLAAGDLGMDGVAEIIVSAGRGAEPRVFVYRQDGSLIADFLAYDAGMGSGVTVAVCDVDGNGESEIVTGTHVGGGPHVRIFDHLGQPVGGFFAYATDFRGGVNVSCADLDGDDAGEIITGPGLTGGPHIKVFSNDGELKGEVFAGSVTDNTGAYVQARDVDGDGQAEVLASSMGNEASTVYAFDLKRNLLDLSPTTTTLNRDALYKQALYDNTPLVSAEVASDLYYDTSAQRIVVDLSEQTLTAYAYGIPLNTYLVSTGTRYYPTPVGITTITDKLLWHSYGGTNYWYPDVKYNLRFRKGYYLHYAYWHNNFGTPMSHGCVNMRFEDVEWIYNWANVGTTVEVVQ